MTQEEKEYWDVLRKKLQGNGWQQGWKVLMKIGGGPGREFSYYGLVAYPRDGNHGRFMEGRVEYPLGERVVPEEGCGPLTVYSDYFSAERRKGGYDTLHIFMCLYKPSEETKVWNKNDSSEKALSELEYGTALAEEVIVIPQVLGLNGNPNNIGERPRGPWIV